MNEHSRRGFAGLILALIFRPRRISGRALPFSPMASPQTDPASSPPVPTLRLTIRRYRVDAVILLLGIPLYRRAGVGGGQASIEEAGEGAKMRRTLFFAAGSDPKRAHGLQRLGWIREVVLGPEPAPEEVDYFGVLTSSPEESLDRARKSIATPPSGKSVFSAVSGRHTAGRSRSAVTHFEFTADAVWSDPALIGQAQSTFHPDVGWRETSWPKLPGQAPPTFLLELATLLKQRAKRAAGPYVYNEQEYLLELEGSQGESPERLIPVRGKVRNLHTGRQTAFRLWIENSSGSIVPVRIEFQPRSFLRLTLETLPA